MQAIWQRHERRRELVDAVVRVGAPEGDAHEQLHKLVQHALLVDLDVPLALRLGRALPAALLEHLHIGSEPLLALDFGTSLLLLALSAHGAAVDRVCCLEHVGWEGGRRADHATGVRRG